MEKILKIEIILRVLKWLFIALLLCTLLILIVQICNMICHCSSISFNELITNWHVLKYLLIVCFSLLTLYVAGKQLQKQTDIAAITALTELRKLLTSDRNRNVHFALSPEEEKVNLVGKKLNENEENGLTASEEIPIIDAYNYLGTIELGILMVRRGLIDTNTFYSQFGYRIENIFENECDDIHKAIRKEIFENKAYYKNLLWGYNEICKKIIK